MKKITALAALSMAGLAVSAAPAQADAKPAQPGSVSFGDAAAAKSWNVTTAELCHHDLASYPVAGALVDRTTGVCEALGAAVDHPQV